MTLPHKTLWSISVLVFSMLCVPERTMGEYDLATLDLAVFTSPCSELREPVWPSGKMLAW